MSHTDAGLQTAAEVVAEPDRSLSHVGAAKLVGETRHIAEVELWPDEQVFRHEKLDAYSRVKLEMVCIADGYGLIRTNRSSPRNRFG